jgi:hypothetical protein
MQALAGIIVSVHLQLTSLHEADNLPLALPTFGREFGELGVQKARIAVRVRYIGIALKSASSRRIRS